jgi:hypothetical protein
MDQGSGIFVAIRRRTTINASKWDTTQCKLHELSAARQTAAQPPHLQTSESVSCQCPDSPRPGSRAGLEPGHLPWEALFRERSFLTATSFSSNAPSC